LPRGEQLAGGREAEAAVQAGDGVEAAALGRADVDRVPDGARGVRIERRAGQGIAAAVAEISAQDQAAAADAYQVDARAAEAADARDQIGESARAGDDPLPPVEVEHVQVLALDVAGAAERADHAAEDVVRVDAGHDR